MSEEEKVFEERFIGINFDCGIKDYVLSNFHTLQDHVIQEMKNRGLTVYEVNAPVAVYEHKQYPMMTRKAQTTDIKELMDECYDEFKDADVVLFYQIFLQKIEDFFFSIRYAKVKEE